VRLVNLPASTALQMASYPWTYKKMASSQGFCFLLLGLFSLLLPNADLVENRNLTSFFQLPMIRSVFRQFSLPCGFRIQFSGLYTGCPIFFDTLTKPVFIVVWCTDNFVFSGPVPLFFNLQHRFLNYPIFACIILTDMSWRLLNGSLFRGRHKIFVVDPSSFSSCDQCPTQFFPSSIAPRSR